MTTTKADEDVLVEQIRDLLTRATPGPWLVVDNRHLNDAYWICAPDEFTSHAEVRSGSGEAEAAGDTLANAQLIALVPQMADAITTRLERERVLTEALNDIAWDASFQSTGAKSFEYIIETARAALTREGG